MNAFCKQCVETQQRCPLCRNDPWPLQKIPLPLRNILAKLKVDCLACSKKNLARGDFDHHVEHVCPIDCPYGCEEKTTRAGLPVHESECLKKPIQCSSSELGCTFETVRSEMALHHSECPFIKLTPILSKHKREYRDLLNMVTTQRKRIRELETELERERQFRLMKKQKIRKNNNNNSGISQPGCTTPPLPQTVVGTNSVPFAGPPPPRSFSSPDLVRGPPSSSMFPSFMEREPGSLSTWLDIFETEPIFPDLRVPPPMMIETPAKPLTFPFVPFAQDFSPPPSSFFLEGGLRTNGQTTTTRWTNY